MPHTPQSLIPLSAGTEIIPSILLPLVRPVRARQVIRFRPDELRLMMSTQAHSVMVRRPDSPPRELTIAHRFDQDDMNRRWDYYIKHRPIVDVACDEELPMGTVLELSLGFVSDSQKDRLNLSGLDWSGQWLALTPEGEVEDKPVSEPAVIRVQPGSATSLRAWLHADGRVVANHFDQVGNPTDAPEEAVDWVLRGPDHAMEDGVFTTGTPASTLVKPPGVIQRVSVIDQAGRLATTNALPRTRAGENIYFGEFHWHSELSSDGDRPLRDALASARDELGLDFAGPADHMGDDGVYSFGTAEQQAEIMRDAERPGRFVGLPGVEWSARYGHANTYTDCYDRLLRMVEATSKGFTEHPKRDGVYPWDALIQGVESVGAPHAILIPHHTNTDSYERGGVLKPEDGRPYWAPMTFPRPADQTWIRAFEIHQGRGSFESETPDPAWRGDVGGYGSSFHSALMRGYRMGVTGGTDNHQGWPSRSGWPSHFGDGSPLGLTAVIADELTTESVFSGLYQRHTYATTGVRIVADVTMNGSPMGSELRLGPDEAREMNIRLHGTADWAAVEVISAGVVIDSLDVPRHCQDFEATWQDHRPGRPCTDIYYYLRARQVDGHCLWCSPFWIDLA
ncbi:MAG: CehA/McbA family metallohydrolase [Planctomycetota bacterium]